MFLTFFSLSLVTWNWPKGVFAFFIFLSLGLFLGCVLDWLVILLFSFGRRLINRLIWRFGRDAFGFWGHFFSRPSFLLWCKRLLCFRFRLVLGDLGVVSWL